VPSLLDEAARRLEALLAPTAMEPDFALDLRAMAEGIRKCCALDPDAALAHVQLSQHVRYPIRQSINASILVAMMAEQLKIEESRASAAVAAALTMNLTILPLQDQLYTRHGALGADGAATLREHPRAGVLALREHGVLNDAWLQIVEQHHEARDGSGYPAGLKDDAICREAQLLALADRYCSMVSERAYRPGLAPAVVLKELHAKHASAIDSRTIGLLVSLLGVYPPGVFVLLANGETAIVTKRLRDVRHPVAFALYLNPKTPYESPRKRLTASQPQFAIERVVAREAVSMAIDPEQFWPRTVDSALPEQSP
jgi:HD-GYP domain-containing protein (c-di-GMP phosphodiesterase class II)